jgi:hypothetical protein
MTGGAAEAVDWLGGDLDRFGEAPKLAISYWQVPRSARIPCTPAIM